MNKKRYILILGVFVFLNPSLALSGIIKKIDKKRGLVVANFSKEELANIKAGDEITLNSKKQKDIAQGVIRKVKNNSTIIDIDLGIDDLKAKQYVEFASPAKYNSNGFNTDNENMSNNNSAGNKPSLTIGSTTLDDLGVIRTSSSFQLEGTKSGFSNYGLGVGVDLSIFSNISLGLTVSYYFVDYHISFLSFGGNVKYFMPQLFKTFQAYVIAGLTSNLLTYDYYDYNDNSANRSLGFDIGGGGYAKFYKTFLFFAEMKFRLFTKSFWTNMLIFSFGVTKIL